VLLRLYADECADMCDDDSDVVVAGSWAGWAKQPMAPFSDPASGRSGWEQALPGLHRGRQYYYKFIVDGVWMTHPGKPTLLDASGAINTVLDVE
jgi:hypothetical protein